MKEMKISQLIETARKEINNFGYSENTIRPYNIIYKQILLYYQTKGIEIYSYDVTICYLREKIGAIDLETLNLNKYQLNIYRCIKILESIYQNNSIEKKYNYNKSIILNKENNELLNNYIDYYKKMGLSEKNLKEMKRLNKKLIYFFEQEELNMSKIKYKDILKFIAIFPSNIVSKKYYLYTLKTFLTYLFNINKITENFSILLPNLKIAKQNKIPSVWKLEEVKKLLESINKDNVKGKRNYAIILLCMTTSMRGIDIINLKLGDINFNKNIITFIQHKNKTEIELPLLNSTKEALLDYINNGRPKTESDYLFLTLKLAKPISSANSLSQMIIKYAKSLKFDFNQKRGIHSFRHTVLSNLFNNSETSISTISEISGHNNLDSLNSYLKTDYKRLSEFTLSLKDFGDIND